MVSSDILTYSPTHLLTYSPHQLTNLLTYLLTYSPEDALLRQAIVLGDGLLLGHVDDWHKGREAWLLRALDALELALGVRGDFERSTHRRMGGTSIRAVGDIAESYSVMATSRELPFCLLD